MMFAPIRAHQRPDGAFLSQAAASVGRGADAGSGIATALCLELLWPRREAPELAPVLRAALDYLERCEIAGQPGAYGGHAGARGPDLRASVLISGILYRFGRRSLADLQMVYRRMLVPARIEDLGGAPMPWLDYDVFGRKAGAAGPVADLVANLDALAMLHQLGQPMAEIPAIRLMLARGMVWAGSSMTRMRALMPDHPEPAELLWAIERAERAGVEGLSHFAASLRRLDWLCRALETAEPPLVGCEDGQGWSCALLHDLRRGGDDAGLAPMLRRVL
ncbi:hypothetical protein [Mangrovicoccus algicola]|uniref:Uncharacterized protein n=1 Tax=Mangrovicoccus algicola TaxID=2771008 RepID=A0A8J7CZ72_9RHOB|nr:hypothetical protein [Mangrovicoccus algicola]MBE3640497.1 hypothetical protein [Mangrovicoccus algicola]